MKYEGLPEFQENIERFKRMEQSDNKDVREAASMMLSMFKQGEELMIRIKVTDPYLAACAFVLDGMGDHMPKLPGAVMLEMGPAKMYSTKQKMLDEIRIKMFAD